MARIRRPRNLFSAAAGTVLCTVAVGATSIAVAPDAHASTTNSARTSARTSACPPADPAAAGPGTLAAGQPPKLRRDKILTVEDTAGSVNVLANDGSSAGALTLLAITEPNHGAVSWESDGSVTYRPTNGYVGFDQFGYTAGDAAGQTSTKGVVGVRVCNVPATNEAVSLVGTFNHSVGFVWRDHASAPAGDTLSLWSLSQPEHGQVGVVGDRVVYVPDTGFFGTDHFTWTVSDGQQTCSTAPVTVRIPVETEVSPVPPIERSPTPVLPVTGTSNLGWLALAGVGLVFVGTMAMVGSRRIGTRAPPRRRAATASTIRRPLRVSAVLVLTLAGLAAAPTAAHADTTITGRVVNASTLAPVGGVVVTARDVVHRNVVYAKTTTGPQGYFSLSGFTQEEVGIAVNGRPVSYELGWLACNHTVVQSWDDACSHAAGWLGNVRLDHT